MAVAVPDGLNTHHGSMPSVMAAKCIRNASAMPRLGRNCTFSSFDEVSTRADAVQFADP